MAAPKENYQIGGSPLRGDPNFRGKHLQLVFSMEDEGVFTTRWSAMLPAA
jgi:hypothetical protein